MTLEVGPGSLEGGANTLLELAGWLQSGRPEPALTGQCRAPWAHEEVAAGVTEFATHAGDQFQDAVALLAALATKLGIASANYVNVDSELAQVLDGYLADGQYRGGG
jgi:hypothetical protein